MSGTCDVTTGFGLGSYPIRLYVLVNRQQYSHPKGPDALGKQATPKALQKHVIRNTSPLLAGLRSRVHPSAHACAPLCACCAFSAHAVGNINGMPPIPLCSSSFLCLQRLSLCSPPLINLLSAPAGWRDFHFAVQLCRIHPDSMCCIMDLWQHG